MSLFLKVLRRTAPADLDPVPGDQPPHADAWLLFGIACAVNLMAGIEGSIVAVGLRSIEKDLGSSLSWIGWTLTGYALATTIMLPIAGKIADSWGRKRILTAAVIVFTVSGVACGFAPNVYYLIFFRVLQGFAAGVFPPTSTGLVSDVFGNKRRSAIAIMTSIMPIGGVLGPSLGGLIVDNLDWRWCFFVLLPIGGVLLAASLYYLPNIRARQARQQLDRVGIAIFATALFAILFGMTRLGDRADITDPVVWSLVGGGIALLVFWVRHEARTPAPLVELALLKWKPFLGANIYAVAMGTIVFCFSSFLPYYAQVGYGLSAAQTGFITTPNAIAAATFSFLSTFLLLKRGYRLPMALGMGIVAAAIFVTSFGLQQVSLFGFQPSPALILASLVFMVGMGTGLAQPAANNACLELMPDKIASIVGLRGMFRSTGGVLGSALFVLALSYASDKKAGMEHIFLVMSVIFIASIGCIFMIPDGAAKTRDAAKTGAGSPAPAPAK